MILGLPGNEYEPEYGDNHEKVKGEWHQWGSGRIAHVPELIGKIP